MPALPTHILVIRFSAMGDVAMTVPVLRNLLQQNIHLRITVVSNFFLQPLFEELERCHFHPAFLKDQHKGIAGIFRLYKELKAYGPFDAVADLHNVLRSQILCSFLRLTTHSIVSINKGRKEKKLLTRKEEKILVHLTTMHERYATVFRNVGVTVNLVTQPEIYRKKQIPPALQAVFSSGKKVIGIAPFAQYHEKMYPLQRMKLVAEKLAAENNIILLLGAAGNEAAILQQWEEDIFSVFNIAGRYSFTDELSIISNLNVMVSMDSANMHLASLYNVPVVSVWGATHPFAGFYGWAQDEGNIVQISLDCRPCSVFGNKPCFRGDHACMNRISEDMILQKVLHLIS